MPDSNLADTGVLTSTFYNTYIREQVVVTCTSGTRPTGVTGRLVFETDTNKVMVYDGSGWVRVTGVDGWASYTPTVSQGASTNIAKTVDYSKYVEFGNTVSWTFRVTLTAAGTAGSAVTLTLPVTAAGDGVGSALIFDTSTSTSYDATLITNAPTTIRFLGDWSAASAGWGVTPNLALASGDVIRGTITYEAS